MFILRKVEKDGIEINQTIGEFYFYISKEKSPESFEHHRKHNNFDKSENLYGFIILELGKALPLFSVTENYIMTESGKTFANISFR